MNDYVYVVREDKEFDDAVNNLMSELIKRKTITSRIVKQADVILSYHEENEIVPDWLRVLSSADVTRSASDLELLAILVIALYCDYVLHQVEILKRTGIQICMTEEKEVGDHTDFTLCACCPDSEEALAKWVSQSYRDEAHLVASMERLGYKARRNYPSWLDILTALDHLGGNEDVK